MLRALTLAAMVGLFCSSFLFGDAEVTEPSGSEGIPNTSVGVTAIDLGNGITYRVWLQLQLSGNGDFFNVGSTESFSGSSSVTTHDENVDVTYNPGPGTHPGEAVLKWSDYGTWKEEDTLEFSWMGQPLP